MPSILSISVLVRMSRLPPPGSRSSLNDELVALQWVPHTTEVLRMGEGIFGSAFPSPDGTEIVYTLINRKPTGGIHEQLLPAALGGAAGNVRWYDCYNGKELVPTASKTLEFDMEGHGFGCVLGTRNATTRPLLPPMGAAAAVRRGGELAPPQPPDLQSLLRTMAGLTVLNLSSFSASFEYLNQTIVGVNASTPIRPLHDAKEATEVYVHGA